MELDHPEGMCTHRQRGNLRIVPYDQAYEEGFEDMPRRVPDIDKIRKAIGFEPKVSLDVVLKSIERLNGLVEVETVPGVGTKFIIQLPLTLAIIQGFQVAVGQETYILPLDAVVECLDLPAEDRGGDGEGVLNLRGRPLPYLRLGRRLGLGAGPGARESVVVVRDGPTMAGLAVDALLGESQTVVKPLGRLFRGVPGVSGSAVLGSGRVALILDVPSLMREALQRPRAVPEGPGGAAPRPDHESRRS